jgi:hypothetical protein
MGPWLTTMLAVDDAERRGDAREALRLMVARPLGPDKEPFWRPWHLERLIEVAFLGPALPRWSVSRWIAAQAHDTLGERGDRRRRRCEQLALEARGGWQGLSAHGEQDALCKLMDHDWVYRQLLLYELGGLSDYARRFAAPDLLAGADRVHDWARAPMTALRLVERAADTVTWEYVGTGLRVELPNIGSAAMVVPGEHVLGRLVPVESGVMLESRPLVVPERTARQVADDPGSWMGAVAEARGEIVTSGFVDGIVSDVRQVIWQLALLGPAKPTPAAHDFDATLARGALALARECLEGAREWGPDAVDPWACLRAAVLHRGVVGELLSVAHPSDAAIFEELSHRLAAPADFVCQGLAAHLPKSAA